MFSILRNGFGVHIHNQIKTCRVFSTIDQCDILKSNDEKENREKEFDEKQFMIENEYFKIKIEEIEEKINNGFKTPAVKELYVKYLVDIQRLMIHRQSQYNDYLKKINDEKQKKLNVFEKMDYFFIIK